MATDVFVPRPVLALPVQAPATQYYRVCNNLRLSIYSRIGQKPRPTLPVCLVQHVRQPQEIDAVVDQSALRHKRSFGALSMMRAAWSYWRTRKASTNAENAGEKWCRVG